MAASDLVLYNSVLGSNMSPGAKSEIRKWFERTTGLTNLSPSGMGRIGHHVKRGLTAVRQSGEATMTGALLGLIHAEGKTGLDVHGIPADAVLWGLGTLGGIWAGDHELAPDALNIASDCLAIFMFRSTTNFLVQRKVAKGKTVPPHLIPGSTVHGEGTMGSEDPILRAAREIHL